MKNYLRLTLLLLLCVVGMGSAWAQTTESKTVTFDITNDKGTNTASGSADQVTKDGITISCTNAAFNASGNYRFYANSTTTVKSTVGNITKVVFTCTANNTTKYGPGCFSNPSKGSYSYSNKTGTWTGETDEFTLAAGQQVRATQIVVTYTPNGETPAVTVTKPTITGETPFTTSTTVTITAGEGAEIYYSLDGSEPNDESTTYNAPFPLTETTTVKAIAYDAEGNGSEVVTKEFVKEAAAEKGTADNPYTPAEANAAATSTAVDNVYVKGIVSRVTSFNSSYGEITYYISEDGKTTSEEFNVYQGLGLNGAKFTALTDLKVGSTVVVCGSLKLYKNVAEFNYGSKIISLTEPTYQVATFEGATQSLKDPVTVTITAGDNAKIYYTLDGTDPTSASTEYTSALTLSATTTVKAIAYYGTTATDVQTQLYVVAGTTHAGTVDDPLTPAEAIQAANAGYTDEVTVHGFVSSVDTKDFSTKYGNLTYYLKSDLNDDSETAFEVFRGKGIDGANFTATSDLPVGSEVKVTGKLVVYNSTPEMNSGSKIVELKKADVKLAEYTVAEAQAVLTAGTQTSDQVYVTGIVSQIDEIAAMSEDGTKQYTNATYYISDDGTTTSQLEVFRGKGLANADFTDALQLEVGDKVKVLGVLSNYTKDDVTTQEITGSQLATLATPVKVSESGYATMYYSQKAFTIPEGVEAYTYTVSGGKLTQAAVSGTIPAGEAVVVKAAAGTYDFAVTTETATAAASNDLLGTDAETALDADADSYFYMVSYDKDGKNIGFYWGADEGAAFTNGAHKAYLKVAKTDAAGAKGWAFNGAVTGINAIQNSKFTIQNEVGYNLQGQRVGKNYRGIVIVNGKKVIK